MNYVKYFMQEEQKLNKSLAAFGQGKMPYSELQATNGKLRGIYFEKERLLSEKIRKSQEREKDKLYAEYRKLRESYLYCFDHYRDLPLVEKSVEIALRYSQADIDTVVGIDRGGRQYAKMVKATLDKIRESEGKPRMKLLFLSVHEVVLVRSAPESGDGIRWEKTIWELGYGNNYRLRETEWGNILVVDDHKCNGNTKDTVARGVLRLQKEGVGMSIRKEARFDHVYFMGEDYGPDRLEDRPLDEKNHTFFTLANHFMKSKESGCLSLISELRGSTYGMGKIVGEINAKIKEIADLAFKTWLTASE